MIPRRYGWRPSKPDHRDRFMLAVPPAVPFPPVVNLEPQCSPVVDQGNLGSCTGNAIAAALEFDRKKQGLPILNISRLFIYYNERQIEGTISEDAGAEIRDGVTSVAALGACSEGIWPYDTSKFAVKPPDIAYRTALTHRGINTMRVPQDLQSLQQALVDGTPIVFGFSVYESFESVDVEHSGNVPMPGFHEKNLGGHATMIVGYDQPSGRFRVRNSWGPHWGQAGYFTMPFEYVTNPNLASDFWVIKATM